MSRQKTSKVWEIEKEELQSLLDSSSSLAEVIQKIGLDPYNGNHKTLNKRIEDENLDLTTLDYNRKKQRRFITTRIPIDNILTENSTYNRGHLKRRLIEDNLLEYKCSCCNLTNMWNNKPLSLQLDHINGVNNDNRLQNLRFLCPNCHSQTETYSGKRHKKIITSCLDCGKQIGRRSKRCSICAPIFNGKNQRKFEISKEELIKLIDTYSISQIGRLFGVDGNAIRQRCRILGVNFRKNKD